MTEVTIPLRSHDEAIQVLGPYDRHAKLLRQALDIEIYTRGGTLRLKGGDGEVQEARRRVEHLLGKLRKGRELDPSDVEEILIGSREAGAAPFAPGAHPSSGAPGGGGMGSVGGERSSSMDARWNEGRARAASRHPGALIRPRAVEPRTASQRLYLQAIEESALTFGVGLAGTGKTFLAVAAAVRALRSGLVRRLVISRPVVEAGERLGFLPGDVQAKLNPYMRPIYDALFEIVGFEDVARLEEAGVIEVAPLAFMRGRTLSHAFVILDEAQNTTVPQMRMFLTRLGEGSSMVVTGDPSQSDLEAGRANGFLDALRRLRGHAGISFVEFGPKDVVRHPLVEVIARAYESGPRPEGKPEGRSPAP